MIKCNTMFMAGYIMKKVVLSAKLKMWLIF